MKLAKRSNFNNKLAYWLLINLLSFFSSALFASSNPNIVLILTDDLAWNSLSIYGNSYLKTPNIDKIGEKGLKFNFAYANPVCSSTRASLMTGKYATNVGITGTTQAPVYTKAFLRTPPNRSTIDHETNLLSHLLKGAGYINGISGKWHLGHSYQIASVLVNQALGHSYFESKGFDYVSNAREGNTNDKAVNAITSDLINFITDHKDTTFFAFASHFTPHTNFDAPNSLINKYVDLGFEKSSTNKGVYEEIPSADYLAMIEHLDNSVGLLVDKLEELDLLDNTMIIFTSDNGAPNRVWDSSPLKNGKATLYEGGIRVPLLIQWPDGIAPATTCNEPVHLMDLYPTIAEMVSSSKSSEIDGESLLPFFSEVNHQLSRESIFWHFPDYSPRFGQTPSSAILKYPYKLIYYYADHLNSSGFTPMLNHPFGELVLEGKLELFNLEDDESEKRNLKDNMPNLTSDMLDELIVLINENKGLLPYLNPKFSSTNWTETKKFAPQNSVDFFELGNSTSSQIILFSKDQTLDFLLYPNPTERNIVIKRCSGSIPTYYQMVSLTGELIDSQNISWPNEENEVTIEPSTTVLPGTYIIKIGNSLNEVSKKIRFQ